MANSSTSGHRDDPAPPEFGDSPPVEGTGDFVDPADAAAAMERRQKASKGGVLGAAMLAVGDIIEPTKVGADVEIVAQADDDTDPLAGLDFGDLPPLA